MRAVVERFFASLGEFDPDTYCRSVIILNRDVDSYGASELTQEAEHTDEECPSVEWDAAARERVEGEFQLELLEIEEIVVHEGWATARVRFSEGEEAEGMAEADELFEDDEEDEGTEDLDVVELEGGEWRVQVFDIAY